MSHDSCVNGIEAYLILEVWFYFALPVQERLVEPMLTVLGDGQSKYMISGRSLRTPESVRNAYRELAFSRSRKLSSYFSP